MLYAREFHKIAGEKEEGIARREAYDMQSLLSHFKVALTDQGVETVDSYRSGKLKRRLQNYFGDSVAFHKQTDPSKPELIYSSHISLKDNINAASQSLTTLMPCSAGPSTKDTDSEKERTLYHAAQIVKAEIKTLDVVLQ